MSWGIIRKSESPKHCLAPPVLGLPLRAPWGARCGCDGAQRGKPQKKGAASPALRPAPIMAGWDALARF